MNEALLAPAEDYGDGCSGSGDGEDYPAPAFEHAPYLTPDFFPPDVPGYFGVDEVDLRFHLVELGVYALVVPVVSDDMVINLRREDFDVLSARVGSPDRHDDLF